MVDIDTLKGATVTDGTDVYVIQSVSHKYVRLGEKGFITIRTDVFLQKLADGRYKIVGGK